MKACLWLKKIAHGWYWLIGPLALIWIIIRSGTDPKRLTYPCQRAAMPIAASWIAAVVGFFALGAFLRKWAKISAGGLAVIGAIWFVTTLPGASKSEVTASPALPVWHIDNPMSTVYVMDNIPTTSGSVAAGDASVPDVHLVDPAIDTLLEIMEAGGTYLYRTTEHPDGIVGADNIVILKGNFQWTWANSTNTDRLKGLIRLILNHPDGFTGEIIVCDNIQFEGAMIGADDNNSEDPEQSIDDVVNTYAAKGYPVYLYNWTDLYDIVVNEYEDGDYTDGYTWDPATMITYPKFTTPSMQYYVSLCYGIWEPGTQTYDADRLCIINCPVLKAHHMAGATIAIKNWIGVLTVAYFIPRYGGLDEFHYNYAFVAPALVARVMAVTMPRLSIVDAEWITTDGPHLPTEITRTKMLFASTDPAAVSWYTAKFALTPVAQDPANTDPDAPGSDYAACLNHWTTYLADVSGYPCTIDSTEIAVYDRRILCECEEPCDNDGDFWKDLCDNCPDVYNPSQEDVDRDGIGDSCEIIRAWYVQADGAGDAPTIQAAIDSCTHGDTVLVADGIYTGDGSIDIDFRGRRIVLKSEHGPRHTIIDCQAGVSDPRRAFTFTDDVDTSVVIDGFTIRGGYGPEIGYSSGGGAIFYDHSSPTVKNCIFTGNSAVLGGAVYVDGASPRLINCTFAGNSAGYGAAVFLSNNASITLENCILAFNQDGLVFYCLGSSTAALSCCDVYGNPGGDWVECIAGQEGLDGNFSADPLFCNVGIGDVGLANETSPCLPANNDCGVLIGALDEGCTCHCGVAWGDVNDDGDINPIDVTFMVQYVYLSNDMRVQPYNCPNQAGDVNCDGSVNPVDMVHFVNYVYLSITSFPCGDPCSL